MAHANRRTPTGPAVSFGAVCLLATALACGGGLDDDSPAIGGAADGGSASKPSKPTKPPVPAVPTVKVAFSSLLPDGTFGSVAQASIASTPELYVVADWTGVSLGGTERLQLLTPAGTLYYGEDIGLQDRDDGSVSVSSLPDGTRRVVYRFGIWGTDIYSYGRTGTWTATVQLLGGGTSGRATVVLQ